MGNKDEAAPTEPSANHRSCNNVTYNSQSQLLQFGTLFHKILGYHHQLAPLNAISKLISFLSLASHVPHLATAVPLDSSLLEFVCSTNFVMIITITP